MADKYLNLTGLTEVASKVNQKLRIVTTMPATSEIDDMVLYNGTATVDYRRGGIYRYTIERTYYGWSDGTDVYYTLSSTPKAGDVVYSDASGTESGYTVTTYDSTNDQIVFNSLTYDRDSTEDTPIYGWVLQNTAETYCPQIVGNELCFINGVIPSVDDGSLILDI